MKLMHYILTGIVVILGIILTVRLITGFGIPSSPASALSKLPPITSTSNTSASSISKVPDAKQPSQSSPQQPVQPAPNQKEIPPVQKTAGLLFEDNFDNANSGWFSGTSRDNLCTASYENGEYSVIINKPSYMYSIENSNINALTDFICEVDIRKISSLGREGGGITFRARTNNTKSEFFYVLIDSSGYYDVGKYIANNWDMNKDWAHSYHIKSDTNHLKVVCKGSQIEIYVNDQNIYTFNDTSIDKGTIRLTVETSAVQSGSHFHFDNFKLYSN